ncbi:hypothetical protein PanWU01x14_079710 [Parasponia andersonii]|uniref:Uncharacterized protein n=1 Tax=Parasponia andersonii TaxID=3476 RepID=A0A2P5DBD3_PARAD|nr:hypothetical protein PanWU01x14_079710 [Parasponia andersonii]
MEHPHNAVLLICSSHEKRCRPYMCDTSYRHSNRLDQFRKSFAAETSSTVPPQEETQLLTTDTVPQQEETEVVIRDLSPPQTSQSTVSVVREEITVEGSPTSCEHQTPPKLVCPLCRGQVKEWTVVDAACRFVTVSGDGQHQTTCHDGGSMWRLFVLFSYSPFKSKFC